MDLKEVDKLISKFRKRKHSNLSKNEESKKNDIIQKSNLKIDNSNNTANIIDNKEQNKNSEILSNKKKLEINFLENNKKDIKENISIFGNIYNSFSNNLNINNKENVFDSNILENYFQELDTNYEESKERRDKIISNKNIEKKEESKIQLNNNNIIYSKMSKDKNYYNLSQNYIIEYSNEENKINLQHSHSLLFKEIDFYLYNNYTPVSYETNNIDIKKYQDLLSILIDKNNINEPIGYITSLLIQEILANNIELDKINILKNKDILNKILSALLISIKNKKTQFFLNRKKIIDILNTQNNQFINYNLLSIDQNNSTPTDFVINLFTNNILNKNNSIIYFYFILLKLNEKNINENLEEIINNFDICLYVILKFLNNDQIKIKNICELLINSSNKKMNLCQYIILKIILGNHEILNEALYAKMFTSFLNFCSIEKLLIADCYNLILFTINPEVKKIFAKCSILIKYKYSLMKQSYKQDENDILLKNKILENAIQFGKIYKNKFFNDYLNNEFCKDKKIAIKENNENIIIIEDKNDYKKDNEIDDSKDKDKNEKNELNKNNNGFFSSIKFAFGFGTNNTSNNKE